MSYTRIWLHCVWSTKNRKIIIPDSFRPELLSHFKEQAMKKNIHLDFVNAHKDHVHALINLGRQQTIADVMKQLKGESSYWINKMNKLTYKFSWQDDYFAGSISHSHVNRVRDYIKNQDEHHLRMTWKEEAQQFMNKYGLDRIED